MHPVLPVLVALTALLAGCAMPIASTPTPPARDPHLIRSVQEGDRNFFDPPEVTIAAGTTLTWDVVGAGHHTIDFLDAIDTDGTQPTSGDLGPGDTFHVSFPQPGTYTYSCRYHSNKQTGMLGSITVM